MTGPDWDVWFESTLNVVGPVAFAWSGVFASHFVRYLLSCGVLELTCAHVPALRRRRLRVAIPDDAQRSREFRASLLAGGIFAAQFVPLIYLFHGGYTQLYYSSERYGRGYLVISFLAAIALHDAYFYWTHRLLHLPMLFRTIHIQHHRSQAPTAWAAFSFHPIESFVQGGIHLLLPLILPMHVAVLGVFVLWTNIYDAILHSGHDVLFARDGTVVRLHARVLNTSLEHELHHAGGRANYGLYFSLWDRLMRTRVTTVQAATDKAIHA